MDGRVPQPHTGCSQRRAPVLLVGAGLCQAHRQAQQAALLGNDAVKDLDVLVQPPYPLVYIVVYLLRQMHLDTGRADVQGSTT